MVPREAGKKRKKASDLDDLFASARQRSLTQRKEAEDASEVLAKSPSPSKKKAKKRDQKVIRAVSLSDRPLCASTSISHLTICTDI